MKTRQTQQIIQMTKPHLVSENTKSNIQSIRWEDLMGLSWAFTKSSDF